MSRFEFNIYTDGSYSTLESDRTYGGFVIDGLPVEMVAHTTNPKWTASRNVGGELLAVVLALTTVKSFRDSHKEDEITVNFFYDYEGVGKWISGAWQCKKDLTRGYRKFVNSIISMCNLKVTWTHVHGHAGIEGNERVDRLITKSDRQEVSMNVDDLIKEIA